VLTNLECYKHRLGSSHTIQITIVALNHARLGLLLEPLVKAHFLKLSKPTISALFVVQGCYTVSNNI
jgi:hypothetical protein